MTIDMIATIAIAFLFGLLVGTAAVSALLLFSSQDAQKTPLRRPSKNWKRVWRKQRKSSEQRATDKALMKVAGLAIEPPTRR